MNDGFILIHRKLLEWEWYSNANDTRLWLHCLLSANWKDGYFEGKLIKRGSFVTSYEKLSFELKLSVQQIRTSLNHLKSTNNITHETNRQYSIISINNYDKYQIATNELTNEQQTNNKRITNEQQTINNNINNNNKEQLITIKENKYNINNNQLENEFDEVWKLYPRKQGKSNALKSYIKARKNGIDKESIIQGINNYKNYIEFNKIETQYIKQGSTWFNQECWNDTYDLKRTIKSERKNIFEELLQEEEDGKETNIINAQYTEKSIS